MRISKQTVVTITGASGGIGRAAVREFARKGCRLALIARGEEGLEAARREAESLGAEAIAIPIDVADAQAVEDAARRIETELGPIDVWVNVAFTNVFSEFWDVTPDEWRRVTDVTYLGYVWSTMAALRRMRPRNRGTIVQVGSALAYRAIPLQSAYCGAKFAIRGFTDSLRSELLHERSNVHITMVQLPAVNTPQFDWARNKTGRRPQPVPPIYQPEVAAEAILYAAYARRREIYVSWSNWKVILGNKLAPGLADRILASAGYSGQLTGEPTPANAPDNLFTPLTGNHGAHGRFDARARSASSELWFSRNRGWLAAGFGLFGGILAASLARRQRTSLPDF